MRTKHTITLICANTPRVVEDVDPYRGGVNKVPRDPRHGKGKRTFLCHPERGNKAESRDLGAIKSIAPRHVRAKPFIS